VRTVRGVCVCVCVCVCRVYENYMRLAVREVAEEVEKEEVEEEDGGGFRSSESINYRCREDVPLSAGLSLI
jgi:hypothetical protein